MVTQAWNEGQGHKPPCGISRSIMSRWTAGESFVNVAPIGTVISQPAHNVVHAVKVGFRLRRYDKQAIFDIETTLLISKLGKQQIFNVVSTSDFNVQRHISTLKQRQISTLKQHQISVNVDSF